jgi:hypothetical protein
MLVLYETAMGYCLFKVSDTAKIESADLWKEFESPEKANKLYVVLRSFLQQTDVFACFGGVKAETKGVASIYFYGDRCGRYYCSSEGKVR